jgi:hypothetical protein
MGNPLGSKGTLGERGWSVFVPEASSRHRQKLEEKGDGVNPLGSKGVLGERGWGNPLGSKGSLGERGWVPQVSRLRPGILLGKAH